MKPMIGAVLVAVMAGTTMSAQQPQGTPAPPAAPTGVFADSPKLGDYKKDAGRGVDEMAKLAQEMVDSVFSFGELGFQEFETSKYLTGILEKNGFTVQRGVAGIPDRVGREVGLGQARDCARLRYRRHPAGVTEAGRRLARIRSSPARRVTAKATTPAGREHRRGDRGEARSWSATRSRARSCYGRASPKNRWRARPCYVRAGVFKNVDVVLFTHVSDNLGVSWGEGGGAAWCRSSSRFEGETAHAAGAPWRGQSALDAVS